MSSGSRMKDTIEKMRKQGSQPMMVTQEMEGLHIPIREEYADNTNPMIDIGVREKILSRLIRFDLVKYADQVFKVLLDFNIIELDVNEIKRHARHLKKTLNESGINIKVTQSQELVAAFYNYRDFKTAHAKLSDNHE
ncbi:TPA: hypothetical protein JLF94_002883 [Escherichia coli]|nr:hypothetical protein [Escherichia coli]